MNDWETACEGKVRYLSRLAAKKAAKRCARDQIKGLTPYQCHHCSLYHLGHRPGGATYLRRGLANGSGAGDTAPASSPGTPPQFGE